MSGQEADKCMVASCCGLVCDAGWMEPMCELA